MVLFGVFRVEIFFAVSQYENNADENQHNRKKRQQNARNDADEGNSFGVRVFGHIKCPIRNDENNDA